MVSILTQSKENNQTVEWKQLPPNPQTPVAPNESHLVALHCKVLLLSTMRKCIKNKNISNKKLKILIVYIVRVQNRILKSYCQVPPTN